MIVSQFRLDGFLGVLLWGQAADVLRVLESAWVYDLAHMQASASLYHGLMSPQSTVAEVGWTGRDYLAILVVGVSERGIG